VPQASHRVTEADRRWPPFPRAVEADAWAPALRARLARGARPLWREAAIVVPVVHADAALVAALEHAGRTGMLVLGLEAATAALDREEHGLAAIATREQRARPTRISRLLLLADDGAERFYRAAESTTRRHAGRVLTCRLDVPSRTLGRAVVGREVGVKAVLVQHKDAVVAVFRAIAGVPSP
jgi:hypothetical protein